METQNRRQTAQIFQFPPPGARMRPATAMKAISKQKANIFEACASGSGWYHDAAILEADRPRKP